MIENGNSKEDGMKEADRLAKNFDSASLQERQNGISFAIDKAKGLELANLRRRYWTLEKAIIKRRQMRRTG